MGKYLILTIVKIRGRRRKGRIFVRIKYFLTQKEGNKSEKRSSLNGVHFHSSHSSQHLNDLESFEASVTVGQHINISSFIRFNPSELDFSNQLILVGYIKIDSLLCSNTRAHVEYK